MEWKAVVGYPNYEVSESGEVRKVSGRMLRHSSCHGYRIVTLFSGLERRSHRVHRLVAMAFLPPPSSPEMTLVAHNDGSRDNNHHKNLRWDTCKGNLADRKLHGTTLDGARNGRVKLTAEQVLEIRKRYTKRHPVDGAAAMAIEFGVTDVAIIKAFTGQNWASLT